MRFKKYADDKPIEIYPAKVEAVEYDEEGITMIHMQSGEGHRVLADFDYAVMVLSQRNDGVAFDEAAP